MDTIARVMELADERNLSLFKLSQLCDVSYSTLKNAEMRGSQLGVPTIERICAALGGHIERLLCGIRNIICKNREAGTMFLASLSLLGYFFWNRWLCSASNQAVICSRVTVLPTLYMKVSLPAITLRAYEEV